MKIKGNYKFTLGACYIGYITQAIIVNFSPLLFVTFNKDFGISLDKIAAIVSTSFCVQLVVDFISANIVDKIGYRKMVIIAHIFSSLGMISLGSLPLILPSAYVGIIIATVISAIGGGLIEVLVSPIAQSCPVDEKSAGMSLLHSFYCWGHLGVVLISTLFFKVFTVSNWQYLSLAFAVIPIINTFLFSKAELYPLIEGGEKGYSPKKLFSSGTFWLLVLLMLCAGASEQSVAQWISAFAEESLNISKTLGDLLGPCMFALCMGIARFAHSKISTKIPLKTYMLISSILCIIAYLLTSFSSKALLALIGCGICGVAVAVMWPGTFSLANEMIPKGGSAMFALLALGGDCGCALGPYVVGIVSSANNDNLKIGILFSIIFPIVLTVLLLIFKKKNTEIR